MTAHSPACVLLDGKTLAQQHENELRLRVGRFQSRHNQQTPTLATILVGDDPASATYVRMKAEACRRVGMQSRVICLPAQTSTEQLLATIDALNSDTAIHGILLQHPVPRAIDERRCFDRIAPAKDVDGVTSLGFGVMALGGRAFGAATPAGIMRLLRHYDIGLAGIRAVVVGRSPILGKPMALMLSNMDATVTLCHSQTVDLEAEVRRAELVVGAVGKPQFIRSEWIADGAVVIDAGYHPGGVGDIDPRGLAQRCSALTPVPGGVGPMTISALISHTLEAAEATEKVAGE